MTPPEKTTSLKTLPQPGECLLGTVQVAEWLGMSREQVWRLWSIGKLPGYRFDRYVRFARSDIEQFLEMHRSGIEIQSSSGRAGTRRSKYREIS